MNRGRHRVGGAALHRVALLVLTWLLILLAVVGWLVNLLECGDNPYRVAEYLLPVLAGVVVLTGLIREIVAAHTGFYAELRERQLSLEVSPMVNLTRHSESGADHV